MKFLTITLFLPVLCGFISLSANAAERLTSEKANSREYLINHGHSPEAVRMLELQKQRIIGEKQVKSNNRAVKFLKNLYHERDITMPLSDFGQSDISSPEAPLPNSIPKTIPKIYDNL